MFERFTERARQVVVLAQDEARALKHNYIGTEHILLGLLREEEGSAAYYAAVALVATGEAAVSALEQLLDRKNHEPKKIVRLLCTIRSDRGKGLYAGFDSRPPDAQRALLDLAPEALEGKELVDLLEHGALAEDESVRAAALDALLALPPPAGREPARVLLDPKRYRAADVRRKLTGSDGATSRARHD